MSTERTAPPPLTPAEQAAELALPAVAMLWHDLPILAHLVQARQHKVLISAALGHLVEQGLITVTDPESWPFAVPVALSEELTDQVAWRLAATLPNGR